MITLLQNRLLPFTRNDEQLAARAEYARVRESQKAWRRSHPRVTRFGTTLSFLRAFLCIVVVPATAVFVLGAAWDAFTGRQDAARLASGRRPNVPLSTNVGGNSTIHPTAVIGENVKIGENVRIDAHAVIADGVNIADGAIVAEDSRVMEAAVVGVRSTLGRRATARSGAILSRDVTVDPDVVIPADAYVGENRRVAATSEFRLQPLPEY